MNWSSASAAGIVLFLPAQIMKSISQKLLTLGHTLPPAPQPVANFAATARIGDLLYVSGQIGFIENRANHTGRLGATLNVAQGYAAAQAAALNVIAHIAEATGDALGGLKRIVKVGVFVASTPDFEQHPTVANGASDLFVSVFGDAAKHARAAVGVAALPLGAAVEVEAIVQLSTEFSQHI